MKTIYVGTKKGLFVYKDEGNGWSNSVHFEGESVFSIGVDNGKVWVSPFTEWTGSSLMSSTDEGVTWEKSELDIAFPKSADTALAKIWQIVRGPDGTLFFGVEPSALFTSNDEGKTWELCEGLWNHPHREKWTPGFGGQCLHTIIPVSESTWFVGMSTGGCYRTEDAGKSWTASNQKILAPFLPDEAPEFGQCVHKIAADRFDPTRFYLQHHWGVYRSDDTGQSWHNISKDKDLPTDFGFGVVTTGANTAFIIPIKADVFRVFPDGKAEVFRTTDAGETWFSASKGLPESDAYDNVLRDSFTSNGTSIAFGTTGGSVYLSDNDGDSWETLANHLPRITCVRIEE